MTQEGIYTLTELAEITGVPPRTIRFYTTEGVLPAPIRGRFAMYGATHLQRLRLIQALKGALVPLVLMKRHLPRLTDAQVQIILNNQNLEGNDSIPSLPTNPEPFQTVPTVQNPLEHTDARDIAFDTLAGALSARQPETSIPKSSERALPAEIQNRSSRRALLVSPALAPSPDTAPEPTGITRQTDILSITSNQAILSNQSIDSNNLIESIESTRSLDETWQRIILAPGVELHVRIPETAQERENLKRLITETRDLFQS